MLFTKLNLLKASTLSVTRFPINFPPTFPFFGRTSFFSSSFFSSSSNETPSNETPSNETLSTETDSKRLLRQKIQALLDGSKLQAGEEGEGYEIDLSLLEGMEDIDIDSLKLEDLDIQYQDNDNDDDNDNDNDNNKDNDHDEDDSDSDDGFDSASDSDLDDPDSAPSIFDRLARRRAPALSADSAAEVLDVQQRRPGWEGSALPADWSKLSLEDGRRLLRSAAEASSEKLARVYAALAREGAVEVAVVRVAEKCNFTDYMVVASGPGHRKLGQLAAAVGAAVEEVGRENGEEGSQHFVEDFHEEQGWVVVDATDVIVHLQTEEVRAYYDIERLWAYENRRLQDSMEEGVQYLQAEGQGAGQGKEEEEEDGGKKRERKHRKNKKKEGRREGKGRVEQ